MVAGQGIGAWLRGGMLLVVGGAFGLPDAPSQDGGGDGWPWEELPPVSAAAGDITVPEVAAQWVVVHYAGSELPDPASFDGGDVWVVSPNGYNKTGELVDVEHLPLLVPLPTEDGLVPPMRGGGYRVTYAFAPGSGEHWTAADNGRYTILLQEHEVRRLHGPDFGGQLLGYFSVRIGDAPPPPPEPEPVFPLETGITFEHFPTPGVPGGEYLEMVTAGVRMRFAEPDAAVEWGEVRREENSFVVAGRAVAPARHDDPDDREEGDARGSVVEAQFELGVLGRGGYRCVVEINGRAIARAAFDVPGGGGGGGGEPGQVVPDGADVRVAPFPGDPTDPALPPAWGAEVWLHFEHPERVVVRSWGRVVRGREGFTVDVTAYRLEEGHEPGDVGDVGADGGPLPPEAPFHHLYELGQLEPGEYHFIVRSGGVAVGRARFVVPRGGGGGGGGGDTDPPAVRVEGRALQEPSGEPHRIDVHYHDRSGLALEPLGAMPLMVTAPSGEILPALPVEFAHTEDLPPSSAFAVYEVHPPRGEWGVEDNGIYTVSVEPGMVADLLGNHLGPDRTAVGRFEVMIWPEPPLPPRPVEIEVEQDAATGNWLAHVGLRLPEEFAARDDWEVHWGEPYHRGFAFVAKVRFAPAGDPGGELPDSGGGDAEGARDGEGEAGAGAEGEQGHPGERDPDPDPVGWMPVPEGEREHEGDPDRAWQVVRHTYELGPLKPGRHLMVVLSNRGHFGKRGFAVEGATDPDGGSAGNHGEEMSPFERWIGAALDPSGEANGSGGTGNSDDGVAFDLFEYAAGTDPLDPHDDCRSCLELGAPVAGGTGPDGVEVRFRRILTGFDVRHRFEVSDDLSTWRAAGDAVAITGVTPRLDGIEEVAAWWTPSTREGNGGRYLRLAVERTAP